MKSISMKLFPKKLGQLANWSLWLLSLIAVSVAFMPFSPGIQFGGLDQSWVFALNQAMSQGLAFGKDIIYTFGPYAFVMHRVYHPSTELLMVSGSLYLAFFYWVSFVFLLKDVARFWGWVFCVLIGGLCIEQDVLYYSFPLLIGLASSKLICFLDDNGSTKTKLAKFYVALLFAPIGFLPLIKGNMLAVGGVIVAISTFFYAKRNWQLAAICVFSPFVSMCIFWIASGQPAAGLLQYLLSLIPIISGYTEAMSVNGNNAELLVYLVASVIILSTILTRTNSISYSKGALFGIYFSYLFFAFKAGFVRHDGHAVVAGLSMMVAAVLLPFVLKNRFVLPAVVFSIISGYYIAQHHINLSAAGIASHFKATYSAAWMGIDSRLKGNDKFKYDFDKAVNLLRSQVSFPVLQGTVDIYSYGQSFLMASGNKWSPRPVIQSFVAYTPALAEANKIHLLEKKAPDNIIFKVESLDGRFPSLDDGASWPVLMYKYRPVQMNNGYLFLQKREEVDEMIEPLKLTREKHKFGDSISLPDSSQPIFVQMEIEPTVIGRLASIFYKSSQLIITLENKDGLKSHNRIISGMAKSGFLISPQIENVTEFSLLYGKKGLLDDKKVKSIEVSSSDGTNWLWKDEYWVTFSQIETAPPVNLSSITKFDGFEDKFPGLKLAAAAQCGGVIDVINGASFVPREYSASSLLSISGWLTTSIDKGTLPDAVYVTLTDKQGRYIYIKTRRIPRPDVGDYFKKTTLNESGYSTIADISAIKKGDYTLGIAVEELGRIKICTNFSIPFKITE